MSDEGMKSGSAAMKRRSFFGFVVAGLAGGYFGGRLIGQLFSRKPVTPDKKEPIRISINRLAVPRKKESSNANV